MSFFVYNSLQFDQLAYFLGEGESPSFLFSGLPSAAPMSTLEFIVHPKELLRPPTHQPGNLLQATHLG